MSEPTDAQLVESARAGDTLAFELLVRRYSGRVYAIGLAMLRNQADASDIVQEAFLNAWRKLDSFRGDASFRSWLLRIATNACLMRMRTRRRRPEVPLELKSPAFDEQGHHERPIPDWSPLADKLLQDHELGHHIRGAVMELPDKYRAVIVLADYEHLSMAEIARALDLTVSNVKTRLHRARLAVRQDLEDYLAARA